MSVLTMRRVSRTYGLGAAEMHALQDIDLMVDAAGELLLAGQPLGALDSVNGQAVMLRQAGEDCPFLSRSALSSKHHEVRPHRAPSRCDRYPGTK
jgi:hypothetical protein